MSINHTVENQMCTGCGICEDVCPKHCIVIHRKKGEYRPYVDERLCINCRKCLKVCPGIGGNLSDISDKSYSKEKDIKQDKYIGYYVALHTGYSTDFDIRFHSASGGLVSSFLIYLLEKNIIDGAVVTGFSDADHITPTSYIARSKEDVLKARSSKYCPVALNKVGNEIAKTDGRYVIVGLPCHIQGFRKRMVIDRKLRERIVGLFSIYCSSGRTFHAQDYIFRHYGVEKQNISYFAYRDNGCLGNLTITEGKKATSVPYVQYYGSLLRSFFKPHRCLTCIDHYGYLADVCFGDIHIKPYSDDKVGVSSWIVRTAEWEKLFQQAAAEGYISMDNIETSILNRSQAAMLYPKRRRVKAVMTMDKLLGREIPQYDKELEKPYVKDYTDEIICHCQRFVGRHRWLWWVIDVLGKGK